MPKTLPNWALNKRCLRSLISFSLTWVVWATGAARLTSNCARTSRAVLRSAVLNTRVHFTDAAGCARTKPHKHIGYAGTLTCIHPHKRNKRGHTGQTVAFLPRECRSACCPRLTALALSLEARRGSRELSSGERFVLGSNMSDRQQRPSMLSQASRGNTARHQKTGCARTKQGTPTHTYTQARAHTRRRHRRRE